MRRFCLAVAVVSVFFAAPPEALGETVRFPTLAPGEYFQQMFLYPIGPMVFDYATLSPIYSVTNPGTIIGSNVEIYKDPKFIYEVRSIDIRFRELEEGVGKDIWVQNISFHVRAGFNSIKLCGISGCTSSFSAQNGITVTYPWKTPWLRVQFEPLAIHPCCGWLISIQEQISFDRTDPPPPGPVVFVPGMAASELYADGVREWPDALGSWSKLTLDPEKVQHAVDAMDVLRDYFGTGYAPFLTGLQASLQLREYSYSPFVACDISQKDADPKNNPRLFVFPYDWRKSNVEHAEAFANYLDCVRSFFPPDMPIDIVAHSMGGLLTRRTQIAKPDSMRNVRQIITVGSPWLGAPKAIGAMLYGDFISKFGVPIRAPILKELSEFFPGVHELLPSAYLFPEFGGVTGYGPYMSGLHYYGYEAYRSDMDAMFRSNPGSAAEAFHADRQDNSFYDSGVPHYLHIVGVSRSLRTIIRVRKDTRTWLQNLILPRSALPFGSYDWGAGDNTVPYPSAARPRWLRDPSAEVYVLHQDVDHADLTNAADVQEEIKRKIINGPMTAHAQGLRVETAEYGEGLPTDEDLIASALQSLYMELSGVGDVVVEDGRGGSTAPDPVTGLPGQVAGLTQAVSGEGSWTLVLDPRPHTVKFTSDGFPFGFSLIFGKSNRLPNSITRYSDIVIPAGAKARIEIGFDMRPYLSYDANDDGFFETQVPPTLIVPFAYLSDVDAPSIELSGKPIVAISATDDLAGVKSVWYSLNGSSFTKTDTPFFTVDASAASRLFVLAEDYAGNRTTLLEYPIAATRGTDIALAPPSDVEIGETVALTATLHSGGSPIAAQTLSFDVGGTVIAAVTNAAGVATATVTPGALGTIAVKADFAGSDGLEPSSASGSFVVRPAATRVDYTGPSSLVYGRVAALEAMLSSTRTGEPIAGAAVSFQLGTHRAQAVTASNGVASAQLAVEVTPGQSVVEVAFAGDELRTATQQNAIVTIVRQPTAIEPGPQTSIPIAITTAITARLIDPVTLSPIAGRLLVMSVAGTSTSGVTDAAGLASGNITLPSTITGVHPLSVSFAGDTFADPASATRDVFVFAATGFVVWGGNETPVAPGTRVILGGPDWWKQVTAGDYAAGAAFKGFAVTSSPLTPCQPDASTAGEPRLESGCWSARPGDLQFPATARHISALISTAIDQRNGVVIGNVKAIAIVEVDDGSGSTRTGLVRELLPSP